LPYHAPGSKTSAPGIPASPFHNWRSPAAAALDLGLLQREVAERLGANTCSVANWELNRTKPALWFLPAIVRFLGYAPWPADGSAGEQLLAYPRERGVSQAELARLLGIDPGTLSRWERNLRMPAGTYAEPIGTFLRQSATNGPPDVAGSA
jgi:transcriptional regulator with XRE-family HTH domain